MENNVKIIQSIQRAINIINCFDENTVALSLNKISERLDLNINTARGIVNTLVANGLIRLNTDNTYSLGLFYLHKNALIHKTTVGAVKEASFQFMEHIAEKYIVSSRLQIASAHSIASIITVNPRESHYLLVSNQTHSLPLHATASGKIFLAYNRKSLNFVNLEPFTEKTIQSMDVLLAQLDEVLRNGYSLENEEVGVGVSSVSVPILTPDGMLFGTMSITTLTPIFAKMWESAMLEMKAFTPVLTEKVFAGLEPARAGGRRPPQSERA